MSASLDDGSRRWKALGVAILGLSCLGLAAHRAPALALVNESPSVPRGLYVREVGWGVARGSMVAVPQPAAVRPYLATLGVRPDVRLLKRAAGVGGDRVCRVDDRIEISGRSVPVLLRDRRGAALPQWRGCRRLGPGELFLLGDTPGSFDSRYFGPVRVSELDGVFRETLTW